MSCDLVVPLRGRVYMANLGYGEKPWLIVSNNSRNQNLQDVLAVRITTSNKPSLESVVALAPTDPLVGYVLCDDLQSVYRDELRRDVGAMSLGTMMAVARGLRAALAL